MQIYKNDVGDMTKMSVMFVYGEKPSKIIFPGSSGPTFLHFNRFLAPLNQLPCSATLNYGAAFPGSTKKHSAPPAGNYVSKSLTTRALIQIQNVLPKSFEHVFPFFKS